MADELSPLERVQSMLGTRSSGVSYQSTVGIRTLDAEDAPAVPTAVPSITPSVPAIGGAAPSPELLNRVRKQQEQRGAESLRRIMEQRDRQFPTPPEPDVPLQGGRYR
jgi:hypothetical protein